MRDPIKTQMENTTPGAMDLLGISKESLHSGTAGPMGMPQESMETGAVENTVKMMDHFITTAPTVIVPRKER